jgi:phage terminase large subunit GpA-like protein
MMVGRVSFETQRAVKDAITLGLSSLRADPPQDLSGWAAEHFRLAGESSHQKGAWEAWPFQLGILDMMADDRIEELAVQKSKRVGYTKMVTAFIAYNIVHRRRKQAVWQPTDDDRDSFVKSEIDPVLDGVEAVKAARRAGSAADDTMKLKTFRDSALHLLGGKAARAYRRITVAVAILDEWDGFDQQIEKSGDPGGLAKGRLEGAPYPKFVGGTTPRIKGLSHVERAREGADMDLRYNIDCPHCGHDHPLIWGGRDAAAGFKWTRGEPASVRHVCPHCGAEIRQSDYMPGGKPMAGEWVCRKTGMRYTAAGRWVDSAGMPARPMRHVGLHVWAAYSPQRSWDSIVREFEQATDTAAKGDVGPLQLFVNETLGETWEMAGERSDDHALMLRAESYALCSVPIGALVLTAGIDVQRNRWEISVYGWGRGLESWVIDHHIIEGNPASEDDWRHLTDYLQRRYTQAHHSGSLGLSAISIDSSDQTQAVYNWVRLNSPVLPNLRAIKGSSEEHRPILGPASSQEVSWRGQKWPNGVKLWSVGVDTAKDLLLGQLAIAKPGPGYVHFSADLKREFYEQLTAEQRILSKSAGRDVYRWVRRRPRNEALDCRNYAIHAAFGLGLHTYTDRRWAQIESAVQPPADLFSSPPPAASPQPQAPITTQPPDISHPQLPTPARRMAARTPARVW